MAYRIQTPSDESTELAMSFLYYSYPFLSNDADADDIDVFQFLDVLTGLVFCFFASNLGYDPFAVAHLG